jgi:hypothetical protein
MEFKQTHNLTFNQNPSECDINMPNYEFEFNSNLLITNENPLTLTSEIGKIISND